MIEHTDFIFYSSAGSVNKVQTYNGKTPLHYIIYVDTYGIILCPN